MPECEITQKLRKEFPEQFYKSGTPCWSEIPKGWEELVKCVLTSTRNVGANVKWDQIKEKLGELRMYASCKTKEDYALIEAIVDDAMVKSRKTCMECGRAGKRKSEGGWISVFCEKCEPSVGIKT